MRFEKSQIVALLVLAGLLAALLCILREETAQMFMLERR
jgi:hypothetical protein